MAKILGLEGKKISDSRGNPTIEVSITLDDGNRCVVSLPQGVSRGKNEAIYLTPESAVRNIKEIIEPALRGADPEDQEKIDARLLELDGAPRKEKLGANAILGVSLAAARVSASVKKIPLWKRFAEIYEEKISGKMPRLFINLVEGGLHARNGLRFQEYLVITQTDSVREASDIGKKMRAYLWKNLAEKFGENKISFGDEGGISAEMEGDLTPFAYLTDAAEKLEYADKIRFGLDAAANNIKTSPDDLFSLYCEAEEKYRLFYLEDPFAENDFENFAKLLAEKKGDLIIAGDDLTTTNLERMQEAKEKMSINSVVIKPNQIGTVTEAMRAVKQAREWEWSVIVSHRGGETMDDWIADFAAGTGADGFKLGAPARPERLVKYNRLAAIEEKEK